MQSGEDASGTWSMRHRLAVGLALRRHAGRSRVVVGPTGRVVERSGRDLREVDLLVGSGGALRNGAA
ncbi:MAG: glutamate mutase L, partial [Thermomonas sp.]